jgi:hypothetical protein
VQNYDADGNGDAHWIEGYKKDKKRYAYTLLKKSLLFLQGKVI